MGNVRATTKSPVPEARQKLAGGATTGQRPRNTNRALEGRKKGTRGLAGNITGEDSDASRAPAGALAVWGGSYPVVPGRSATFTTG